MHHKEPMIPYCVHLLWYFERNTQTRILWIKGFWGHKCLISQCGSIRQYLFHVQTVTRKSSHPPTSINSTTDTVSLYFKYPAGRITMLLIKQVLHLFFSRCLDMVTIQFFPNQSVELCQGFFLEADSLAPSAQLEDSTSTGREPYGSTPETSHRITSWSQWQLRRGWGMLLRKTTRVDKSC